MSGTTIYNPSEAKNFMTLYRLKVAIGSIALFLLGCDIPYVAEGSWDIHYDFPGQQRVGVWHVSEKEGVSVEGELTMRIDEFDLTGSRMSWSANAPNPLARKGATQRLNFNGTVDGNRFAGTLYTQSGNLTITGTRQ